MSNLILIDYEQGQGEDRINDKVECDIIHVKGWKVKGKKKIGGVMSWMEDEAG